MEDSIDKKPLINFLELELEQLLSKEKILPLSLALLLEHIKKEPFIFRAYNIGLAVEQIKSHDFTSYNLTVGLLCNKQSINFFNIYWDFEYKQLILNTTWKKLAKGRYFHVEDIRLGKVGGRHRPEYNYEDYKLSPKNKQTIREKINQIVNLQENIATYYRLPFLYLNKDRWVLETNDTRYKDLMQFRFNSEKNLLDAWNASGKFFLDHEVNSLPAALCEKKYNNIKKMKEVSTEELLRTIWKKEYEGEWLK